MRNNKLSLIRFLLGFVIFFVTSTYVNAADSPPTNTLSNLLTATNPFSLLTTNDASNPGSHPMDSGGSSIWTIFFAILVVALLIWFIQKNRVALIEAPKLPLISEFIFIIFPFIVWIVCKFVNGRLVVGDLIYMKDWSFAATILAGQTLIKLAGGFATAGKTVISIDKIILITALLIVLLLMPAVIILAYVANASETVLPGQQGGMPFTLASSQIALFIAATIAYFTLGGWGLYLQNKYSQSKAATTLPP